MSESSQSEDHVFAEALALPEGDRPRFLDEVCRGDAGMRDRIESLLQAHKASGRFMDSPAVPNPSGEGLPPAAAAVATEVSGTRIGRYKLLQKIGEGGCGVVWMAEQEEPVRRQVALKIIKLGMDTREVIARFEAERQALAMMDHPNIAKILDAGATETGRPFFVMELVRGIKITDFCDRNNLSMVERLGLFSQVCHAVQHAHQKGIIHRDLKPSNILVTLNDGVPVPKVIDFGIAKATSGRLTDRTLFTAFEQFIGTPAYMSPEQAELSGTDVDTRSDIYSLGVLLYELLTGRLPFDPKSLVRAGIDEIRRIIREVEPPKPSTNLSTLGDSDRAQVARFRSTDAVRLSLLLRGDLDWIVMRCLEKQRSRRYETPNALAADIARHLNNEPVVARPPSRIYRLNRFVRRNRFACAAAGAVALAMVTGSVASTWQAVRATRAEKLADIERAKAVAERTRAEDLLKFMMGDLYTQLDRVGRLDVLESVAAKATEYFASVGPDDQSESTRLSRARSLWLLGEVRMAQARYADAEVAFKEAQVRASELAAQYPKDGDALFERGQTEFGLGLMHWKRSELSAATEWITRYRDTSASLVALDPSRPEWRLEAADAQYNLAILIKERGEGEAARSEFLGEVTTLQKLIAADPGNVDLRDREAEAHFWLGNIAELQGAYDEALTQYTTQSSLLESLAGTDSKTASRRQYFATALLYVATVDTITGRYPAAGESLARARKLLEDLVTSDPENIAWEGLSLNADLEQASLATRQGDLAGALAIVDKALPRLDSIAARETSDRSFAELLLKGWRMRAQLQFLEGAASAEGSARRAVELGEKLASSAEAASAEVAEGAQSLLIAGRVAAERGDAPGARGDWLRAFDLLAPRVGRARDWRILDPYARAAALLGRSGKANDTIEILNHFGYVPIEPWPLAGR